MQQCDVLIVGGGPAGSSCALGLRGSGLDVVVWDGSQFPRDKVCAGWITPQILRALQLDPGPYAKDHVLQPIHGFSFMGADGRSVDVGYEEVVSYGILRREFDHYLLQRCGARLELGEPVRQLASDGDGWIVNDKLRARLLVGAGGHFCPVARQLAPHASAGEGLVVAREVEFEMTAAQQSLCPVRPEVPELFFLPDLRGYGWIFRKRGYLNVGVGRQDARAFPAHLQDFMALLERLRRLPPGVPDRLRGHAYLLYDQATRPLLHQRALLIGDAAGIAYPRSGEGIRPAVESGLLAARAIAGAQGRYDDASLAAYPRSVGARLGRRKPSGPNQASWLPGRLRLALARGLLAQPWFARRVVMDGWFLHRKGQALA